MVLVSIIIGLGLTHLLQGVGGIIDRRSGHGPAIQLSSAHSLWLAYLFWWMVSFWWWEFRFSELNPEWTLGLYLFLIFYAVSLFLLTVILVPRTWDGIDDVNEYFLARRVWFYSFFFLVTVLDIVDAYLKNGWSYVLDQGPFTWSLWGGMVVMCLVGIRSRDLRYHSLGVIALLALQVLQGFVAFPALGF